MTQSLDTLVRVVIAALAVPAAAVLVREAGSLRVAARSGLSDGDAAALAAHVDAALRARPAPAGPGGEPVSLDGLPGPHPTAAALPFGGSAGGASGVLLALGVGEPRGSDRPAWRALLADLGGLAALAIPAGSADGQRAAAPEGVSALLADALESLPESIAIFDRDDRFVFWNRQFERAYTPLGVRVEAGTRFEDHLRSCLAHGHIVAARGCEEDWLRERMARFASGEGSHEHQLGDGRWVRVQDRPLAHGGKVGIRTDITDLVGRESSFRLLFDANPAPMLVVDRDTLALLAVNDAAVAFYGYERDVFLTLTLPRIRPEREPGEIAGLMARVGDSALANTARVHLTAGGDERFVKVNMSALGYAGRQAVLVSVFDLTEQHRMEEEVERTRAFLKAVVDSLPVAVFVKDMWDDGRYVIFNRANGAILGRPGETMLGRSDRELLGDANVERFARQDRDAMRAGAAGIVEEGPVHHADGRALWVRTRKVTLADGATPRYVLGIAEDLTDRRAGEAQIAHRAHHDALTDLPNRFLLGDRLEAALARLGDDGREMLALLCIDLDGFKAVNDTWGHAVGDELLCAVAARLRDAVRGCDTVSRFGGDEFVVLQSPIAQMGEAAWLAGRLVSRLGRPYAIGGHDLSVGASIGIALARGNARTGQDLLHGADAALYTAKREGRNRFCFAASTPEAPADQGAGEAPPVRRAARPHD